MGDLELSAPATGRRAVRGWKREDLPPSDERKPASPRFPRLWQELRRIEQTARDGWRRGRRPWLGIAAAVATIVTHLFLEKPHLGHDLWRSGDVSASLPWAVELWRLPMSLFLPTPYLPAWGAVAQLFIVLGLGELVLGRWITLLVAGLGQVAATFMARILIDSSAGRFVGLPHLLAHALDTGPSAVTVAVGACLLMVSKCPQLTAILAAALLAAAWIGPGLDGPEHLIALVCGVLVGAGYRRYLLIEDSTASMRRLSGVSSRRSPGGV